MLRLSTLGSGVLLCQPHKRPIPKRARRRDRTALEAGAGQRKLSARLACQRRASVPAALVAASLPVRRRGRQQLSGAGKPGPSCGRGSRPDAGRAAL